MDIEPKHLAIIQGILQKYPYSFYVFGSRVKGNPRPFSDLDLCYQDDIPQNILNAIEEDFEESDLPYSVDLVNWNQCSPEFQKSIQADMVPWDKNLR
jgi:type I restriction enzyme S subunit